MKALILASGVGRRLRPLTNDKPKSLIKIGSNALLDYQLDSLIVCNIRNIIITTGHLENKLREHVTKKYPHLNVSYVNNAEYDTTNYIYSLWLAKELIDDDMILLHGDLFFDKKLLCNLINANEANCVMVNSRAKPPGKDFKAVIKNNRVTKIGVELSGENALSLMPLYKLSRPSLLYWLEEIERFIKSGDKESYAEEAFNQISDKIILRPLYFDEEFCLEIDTKEDLKTAKNIIKDRP